MNREMLIIIAIILTVLIALPLWRVVALFLWNDGIVPLIITVILLAVFATILILATKISNAWLLGAVWTVSIALFAGIPIVVAIADYYHNGYEFYIVNKFVSSVENGAPDKEIRRLHKKIKLDGNSKAFATYVRNSRFDLAREMLEKGEYHIHNSGSLLLQLIHRESNEKEYAQAAFLLDNGISIHRSAIIYAISYNNIDMVKLLLQHGASPNKGLWGDAPLCHAKSKGDRDEIITLLLEYGAVCDEN